MNNLLEYLEASARRFPNKTAFTGGDESVTFGELLRLANSIGTAVHQQAGGIRRPVAVITHHTVADIAAFMGILTAGCFYVPLDGTAPPEHTEARMKAIQPAMVINAKTVRELPQNESGGEGNFYRGVLSADPAYAIFTSGSTGVPKAALVSHAGVINLIEWQSALYGYTEDTVFAGQSPFYFDASVQDTYGTLRAGASLFLLPRKLFMSPLHLLKQMDEWKVNTLTWATAGVKLLAASKVFNQYTPVYLKQVIFGGENMPAAALNIWRKALPHCRFVNEYGPSEISVACSAYVAERELDDSESVPIGEAGRNMEMLLDEQGEIYVRGAGVGLGYYRDARRTAEVFVQNPFHEDFRDTVYKTGDIAKYNAHGELVYVSRTDDQIKHMGNRIELGEIEAASASVSGVDEAFCYYDKANGKLLLFYQGAILKDALTGRLAEKLPHYMRPSRIIKVAEMPRLPNGKTDKLRARKEFYEEAL